MLPGFAGESALVAARRRKTGAGAEDDRIWRTVAKFRFVGDERIAIVRKEEVTLGP